MSRIVQVRELKGSSRYAPSSATYKVIILGNSGVGKTCIACAFGDGAFPQMDPETTIGVDFKEKSLKIDGEIVTLQLWDTAGQERFRQSMTSRYYRDVHAVLLLYDVTNRHSFHNLRVWITEYYNHSQSGNALLFLIGNKNDLKAKRVVEQRSGQGFAEAYDFTYFWETSVKEKQDEVNHIFYTIGAMLKNKATPRELLSSYHDDNNDVILDGDSEERTDKTCCGPA